MRISDAVAKKRRIMDAACRLLVQRGFQDIALDDVAREAGMAKGTLFLYYRSKDDLLASAYADMVDQLGGSLAALLASGKRGRPLLSETVKIILDYFHRKRDFLSHFGAGRFPACGFKSQEMLMDKFKENSKKMISILKRCAQDGVIQTGDFSYAAFALVGLCRSAMLQRIVAKSKQPLEKDAQKVIEFFLHGTNPSFPRRRPRQHPSGTDVLGRCVRGRESSKQKKPGPLPAQGRRLRN